MIEKALLLGLVAVALVAAASGVAGAIKHEFKTMQCAFDHATVCIYD